MSIHENARYGLADGSGKRISILFEFGDCPNGIRHDADLFLAEYARRTGASNPGTSLLYEFVDAFVKAFIALACFKIPPI